MFVQRAENKETEHAAFYFRGPKDYISMLTTAMPFQTSVPSCHVCAGSLCLPTPTLSLSLSLSLYRAGGLPPVNFAYFSLCGAVDVWWQVMTLSMTLS